MSVSATTVHRLPRESRPSTREPLSFRALTWVTLSIDVGLLVAGATISPRSFSRAGWEVLVWALLVALVGLAPIASGRGPYLVMDLPLLLGAAFVYGPLVGGLVAFTGCWDIREFRREISVTRSLWNRAQTSLAVMAAAAVFAAAGGRLGLWPRAVVAALLALAADSLVNYGLVALAFALPERVSPVTVIARMKLGPVGVFATAYLSFGLLGLLLAEIYARVGSLGLLAFVAPVLLAHQAFSGERKLDHANRQVTAKQRALVAANQQAAGERKDERQRIAAALHDDVVQGLHSVTLYANVIRRDLNTGRLLDLDEDLPALLRASEAAAEGLRAVIRGLRQSSLGRDGLEGTLGLLAKDLADESGVRITAAIEPVGAASDLQLTIYQIAREALTNAIKHSNAGTISVVLRKDRGWAELTVSDDGVGFDMRTDHSGHFGIQLMQERAELSGGFLEIRSVQGVGTTVIARFEVR